MTTELLGFDSMDYNVVYAQMGRGKMERNVAFALASVAGTLAKMAFDACLFNCQNFNFVRSAQGVHHGFEHHAAQEKPRCV
jgi:argininosuccinate lyase